MNRDRMYASRLDFRHPSLHAVISAIEIAAAAGTDLRSHINFRGWYRNMRRDATPLNRGRAVGVARGKVGQVYESDGLIAVVDADGWFISPGGRRDSVSEHHGRRVVGHLRWQDFFSVGCVELEDAIFEGENSVA